MKEREIYSSIRALSPFIVRLDGRAFHRFTKENHFTRPFDKKFADVMAEVTAALLKDSGFSPVLGYTFSDEISLYFDETVFDGRVEKIDSVLASFAASIFTILFRLESPISFDSRIIPINQDHLLPYLISRQSEAWRNHINGWSSALLINDGLTTQEVTRRLDGVTSGELHELCHERGVNLALTPAWQRRGILVYKTDREKAGYNPIKKEVTSTIRRKVTIDMDIPLFNKPDGIKIINKILTK